jgi:hypothetical protein
MKNIITAIMFMLTSCSIPATIPPPTAVTLHLGERINIRTYYRSRGTEPISMEHPQGKGIFSDLMMVAIKNPFEEPLFVFVRYTPFGYPGKMKGDQGAIQPNAEKWFSVPVFPSERHDTDMGSLDVIIFKGVEGKPFSIQSINTCIK